MRQQTAEKSYFSTNQRLSSLGADLTKHFTNSSQKWTIICTSNLHVKFTTLQVS
jgi:hypothetical protein